MTRILESQSALPQPPILPSNGVFSPWAGPQQAKLPLRVLQEHSGNRQYEHAQTELAEARNLHFPANENYYQLPYNQYDAKYVIQADRRSHVRQDRHHRSQQAAQYDREAKRLYDLFWSCEPYKKYRNRQPQKCSGKVVKWPDELEEAFLRALCKYLPVGRKKDNLPGQSKLLGRNELLADFVTRFTGEKRDRKQISSHIQVLKEFVKDVPDIMFYLKVEKPDKKGSARTGTNSRRQASARPVAQGALSCSRTIFHTIADRARDDVFPPNDVDESTKFEFMEYDMSIVHEGNSEEKVHTYTHTRNSTQLQDVVVRGGDDVFYTYPELKHAHCGDVFLSKNHCMSFQASIALLPPSKIPKKVELGVQFIFQGRPLRPHPVVVKCKTLFFENGVLLNSDEDNNKNCGFANVTVEEVPEERKLLYQVPFGSKYWALTLHRLGSMMQQANDLRAKPLEASETVSLRNAKVAEILEHVAKAVRGITAVQSVVASDGKEEWTLANIHWSFLQAAEGEPGRTTWHNIIKSGFGTWQPSEDDGYDFLGLQMERCDSGTFGSSVGTGVDTGPSACLLDDTNSQGTPRKNYAWMSGLQSPINFSQLHLDTSSQENSVLDSQSTDFSATSTAASASYPSAEDANDTAAAHYLQHAHPAPSAQDFDFVGGNIDISFDDAVSAGASTTAALDHFSAASLENTALDLSDLQHGGAANGAAPTDPALLGQYSAAQWNTAYDVDCFFETPYRTIGVPSQHDAVYPAPEPIPDVLRSQQQQLAAFGHGEFPAQAYAGAEPEEAKLDSAQALDIGIGRLGHGHGHGHGCGLCASLPYCACPAGLFE